MPGAAMLLLLASIWHTTGAMAQEHVLTDADRALILAAEQGHLESMQAALTQGAWIDARDSRGRTAIMAATHGNQAAVVATLLAAGANMHIQDNRLDNPFLYAGAEGLSEILELLIEAGPNTRLTNRFGGTALIPAAERGHVEIVRMLLSRTDVDVNHINNLGWTALLEAIVLSQGGPRHQEIVRILLDYGADPAIADKAGVTPLQHARSRGFREIEQMLVEARR